MRAVLFDLDGTLLDLDLEVFLRRYFGALAAVGETLDGVTQLMPAIHEATRVMMQEHPGRTNQDVFDERFEQVSGKSLASLWPVFERFYSDEFPLLGTGMSGNPGAREAVKAALDLGMKVAVATNPIFPEVAVRHRMSWAGVGDMPVDLVTTYENMHSCKPFPAYYREVAEKLCVEPADCLMVGDDRVLDLSAADVGMRTYYVGDDRDVFADYRGTLEELAELMPRIAALA